MTLPVVFTANGQAGYNLTKSLRFRSSASAYLNRTPASAGNRKTMTFSFWVKRGLMSSTQQNMISAGTGGDNYIAWSSTNDYIEMNFRNGGSASNVFLITTQVFRDPSAWYHIVLAIDTTQATASNRVKLYVNGSQVTAFGTTTYPTQNNDLNGFNNNVIHHIGQTGVGGFNFYLDGYLAEVNFIDGQQLTPSSFGETSTTTGVWIPKKYTGTYGTNGFYLPFTDTTSTSTLGTDFSGNSNTWTVNNISLTSGSTYDSMNDVPTLTDITTANYCVLNPTLPIPAGTISQGNLNYLRGSTASHGSAGATFTLPITGKWYWEVTACANSGGSGNNETIGVANILNNPQLPAISSEIGGGSRGDYGYRSDGNKYNNGNQGAYGATYTNSDVIGVAWDSDAGTLVFYKNGSSQGTAFSSIAQVAGKFVPASSNAESSNGDSYNFGQRPFTYTPPTGFVALNTFNLPTPTIGATASSQANKYMNIALYTGTGSSQSITGLGFQPDWTWIKGRSGATDHGLYDAVRGVQKQLESNNTDAETTETTGLTAFGSDGFTVGALAQLNTSSATYVGWNWKANGAGSSNTAGSITSTVSANTTSGFSIATYTGTGSNATVGHGLGVAPSMVIVKRRDSGSSPWNVWHTSLTNGTYFLVLNTTAAQASGATRFTALPTSTVINIGTDGDVNANTGTYVAYCFAPVAGYSAFGSYTGNGSTDGPFVYTGFRPRFVLVKESSSAGNNWVIYDTARDTYNECSKILYPNASNAEFDGSTVNLDILSNGFKPRDNWGGNNNSGNIYIYMAFAESPFKYSNAR